MASSKSHYVREKKFPSNSQCSRKGSTHHSAATITDDHTLFLLHQQRDKLEKRSAAKTKWWRFGF